MKKKFLLDLDDTLGYMMIPWVEDVESDYGIKLNIKSLEDVPSWDYLVDMVGYRVFDILAKPGFYSRVKPMNYAQEVLQRINDCGHEIKIVTATHHKNLSGKVEWVEKHFPFLNYNDFIVAYEKHHISGDFLIDDNAHKNLTNWCNANRDGVGIAFAAGYNKGWNPRINSWYELPQLLKNYNVHI